MKGCVTIQKRITHSEPCQISTRTWCVCVFCLPSLFVGDFQHFVLLSLCFHESDRNDEDGKDTMVTSTHQGESNVHHRGE